ncbi:GerMN domain-containing protein [Sporolactobacillus sp. THM19-2]|jgi:germination protein M|uniref:GerMN domain-containing protein n=1 Tax=Sporolactobacillus sp. THM19-2 TaxID=2511171 RepID=UPI001021CC2D|nr:GerMN domain-containing protein [Sporolactobacillus sp. THM19-2]RYL94645.1 spore gernimation protein [Sporolactobacillus sp. THM19-2]
MIRRSFFVLASVIVLLSFTLLSACGDKDSEPDTIKYVKDKQALKEASKNATYIQRKLYLSDANGLLIPQVTGLPESGAPESQVLNYLVKGGPVTELLPNGFQAVLPAETEVVNVDMDKRGNLTVDFSREFLETRPEDQERAVQSVVWTLTEFNTVKSVSISVDGKVLDEWPDTRRSIGRGLTRQDGINTTFGDVSDVAASGSLTVFYLTTYKNKTYEVPVTVRTITGNDRVSDLVSALVDEPADSPFISTFNPDTRLIDKPMIKDGVVTLHFNDAVYEDKAAKTISERALRCLVRTLTSQKGINKVEIKAGDSDKVMLESGKTLTGPVSESMVSASGL